MTEYEFTLIFKLAQDNANAENYLDLLYEAGCDDALPGIGKLGYLSLDFIRESSSAFEAIKSAVENVKSILDSAKLIHISPDLVGVKELANIFNCSRQNIQKVVTKSTFPNPVYKGSQAIWHLATVLDWFITNNYEVNQDVLEISQLTMSINLYIGNKTTKPQTLHQAQTLLCA